MTAVKRTFGKPASLNHLMGASKEFTDAAMNVEIDEILHEAKRQRNIGRTAAHLTGVRLQREGDGDSKQIVLAAYDTLYDLLSPSLTTLGPDTTRELFGTDTTRRTLLGLSETISSYALSTMTHRYRTQGSYLRVTDNGLELDENCVIPKKFESTRGGCPYAKSKRATYFNRFTDHIVDTYAEAQRQDMPHGWLEATSRLLHKK